MANDAAEKTTFTQNERGVDINLKGEIKRSTVDAAIDRCAAGTCPCCTTEFVAQLDDIAVEGKDGDVTIHVMGPVTTDIMAEKFSTCDCLGK